MRWDHESQAVGRIMVPLRGRGVREEVGGLYYRRSAISMEATDDFTVEVFLRDMFRSTVKIGFAVAKRDVRDAVFDYYKHMCVLMISINMLRDMGFDGKRVRCCDGVVSATVRCVLNRGGRRKTTVAIYVGGVECDKKMWRDLSTEPVYAYGFAGCLENRVAFVDAW